jgi:3-oxoadipate enol-lactonase
MDMAAATDGTFNTSDGCSIAYTMHPAPAAGAPRMALIHSLALDRSIWNGVVTELAAHAQVLTYDCRGHGRSCRVVMKYTAALFARDLAELLDHVGWQSAAVAGCSMGGCVAQAFASMYAPRTEAACLIDTTAWYGAQAPQQWRERAETAAAKGMGALIDFQVTRWFGDAFRTTRTDIVNALVAIFLANDVQCYRATCEMLGADDLRPLLAAIRAPTAVVVGEEDYATPVSMAQALHRAIGHSTLTVIPGGRHITPAECPHDIARALRQLIAH